MTNIDNLNINENQLRKLLISGNVEIPLLLMQDYHKIGLNNKDLIILLQLFAFAKERIYLPSTKALSLRTNFSENEVDNVIGKLLRRHFLQLTKNNDGYDLSLLIIHILAKESNSFSNNGAVNNNLKLNNSKRNIYRTFQQEFSRTLTPMELQTIGDWLDKDKFAPDMITLALQQAVNSQVFSLRYIEKILLNWKHEHIQTKKQAEKENLKHRQQYFKERPDFLSDSSEKSRGFDSNQNFKIPFSKIGEKIKDKNKKK